MAFGDGPDFFDRQAKRVKSLPTHRSAAASSPLATLAHPSSSIRDEVTQHAGRASFTPPAILSQQPEWRSFPSKISLRRAGRQNRGITRHVGYASASSVLPIPGRAAMRRSSAFHPSGDSVRKLIPGLPGYPITAHVPRAHRIKRGSVVVPMNFTVISRVCLVARPDG